MAMVVFGLGLGAALATVVGPLIEVAVIERMRYSEGCNPEEANLSAEDLPLSRMLSGK